MLSTVPSMSCPRASTAIATRWPGRIARELRLLEVGDDPQLVLSDEGEQRLARLQDLTRLDALAAHDAARRRLDHGVFELQLRFLAPSPAPWRRAPTRRRAARVRCAPARARCGCRLRRFGLTHGRLRLTMPALRDGNGSPRFHDRRFRRRHRGLGDGGRGRRRRRTAAARSLPSRPAASSDRDPAPNAPRWLWLRRARASAACARALAASMSRAAALDAAGCRVGGSRGTLFVARARHLDDGHAVLRARRPRPRRRRDRPCA